ncbi:hypothetical protein CTEN210_09373 [Chaetoceros tenuissimus]|uniref:Rhodanese domain-containing protein n=1 Tax=Chaetoceros tenuissimus TaxID=426638 RepID=A0AAD3CVP2_9STRA|nr:hypothetical protein CTEN210_09373 [Chaetoceros tenuissimus]
MGAEMDQTMTLKTNKERCAEMSAGYHSNFPIETLTSAEYLQNIENGAVEYTLIDVRSPAEQKISMIPNAITLKDFESDFKRDPTQWIGKSDDETPLKTVVTYCTIGYRSGVEAQRIKSQYHIPNVKNLDGIVCYTHVCSEIMNNNGEKFVELIEPRSKQKTSKVHVFGSSWNYASKEFTTVWFSKLDMAARGIIVMLKSFRVKVCSCCH